jgi:hypothetical protein
MKELFETCSNISIRVAQQSARILMLEQELEGASAARSDNSPQREITVADDF